MEKALTLPTQCHFFGREAKGQDGTSVCKPVGELSHFCQGCEDWICDNHDSGADLPQAHDPIDHLAGFEDFDEGV